MSHHRRDVRPRYGRIGVLAASVTISAVAALGGFGILATGSAQAGAGAKPASYTEKKPDPSLSTDALGGAKAGSKTGSTSGNATGNTSGGSNSSPGGDPSSPTSSGTRSSRSAPPPAPTPSSTRRRRRQPLPTAARAAHRLQSG